MARCFRLYAPELPASGGELRLPEEALRHAQVLRLAEGDEVQLFDGKGRQAQARITSATRSELRCVAQPATELPPPGARVTLVLCVPKANKLETIARMATELGVHALRLADSERSVPRLSAESPKVERLRRVAREACAQSGQPHALEIDGPGPLLEVASCAPRGAHKLVFWERAEQPLAAAFGAGAAARPCDVWAVVGPEGGLGAHEAHALVQQGYAPVGLASGILRVDTAAVVIATLLLDRLSAL